MGLNISVCEECGEVLAPPRQRCPECRSEMKVFETSGMGVIVTHTTIHVVPEGFEAPIMVGLVKLDAGGQVLARADFDLVSGMRVDVEELEDGTHRIIEVE
jgi:uncharacterized OB-fold protein